ncbi:hypothetical protein [Leptospira interrogans]|nr:hypothetical protein [Leptospira interrogans]AKP25932.1 hypothetical protein LIMLP_08245 [Leptospira interrogans serovar Manilae]AKP29717.1 hypothetical protein LIMHP_08240 [Leptospira interrogans serovar Manilae]EYU62478.1 hypothetical protein CI00_20045 [Leptospira interrogans serovar Manilae]
MKVTSIDSKRKRNSILLRKGKDIIFGGDCLHLKYGSLWIQCKAYPTLCFPITLTGAKGFLKNGKVSRA